MWKKNYMFQSSGCFDLAVRACREVAQTEVGVDDGLHADGDWRYLGSQSLSSRGLHLPHQQQNLCGHNHHVGRIL